MIGIGSDHVGFEMKEKIKFFLDENKVEYIDLGCDCTERTDYTIYASRVANKIVDGDVDLGILICGTGVGMCIAANKVKGIRATVCTDEYSAKMSRLHNDCNILTLGCRVISIDIAQQILTKWLHTKFEKGRHIGRINQIKQIEKGVKL